MVEHVQFAGIETANSFQEETRVLWIPRISISHQYQKGVQQNLNSCSRSFTDKYFYYKLEYACYTK